MVVFRLVFLVYFLKLFVGNGYLLSFPQFQLFVSQMISMMCNSKSYTVLGKINFSLLIFQRCIEQEKPHLFKNYIWHSARFFQMFLVTIVRCVYLFISSAAPQQNGGAHTNMLICGQLYHSQHDKFEKHGFELKLFFSVFSKYNQIKINKAKVSTFNYRTPSKL